MTCKQHKLPVLLRSENVCIHISIASYRVPICCGENRGLISLFYDLFFLMKVLTKRVCAKFKMKQNWKFYLLFLNTVLHMLESLYGTRLFLGGLKPPGNLINGWFHLGKLHWNDLHNYTNQPGYLFDSLPEMGRFNLRLNNIIYTTIKHGQLQRFI